MTYFKDFWSASYLNKFIVAVIALGLFIVLAGVFGG